MNQNIILRRMRRSPFFVVGFVLALSILLICFVSPLFVAYDAEKSSISERLLSPVAATGAAAAPALTSYRLVIPS